MALSKNNSFIRNKLITHYSSLKVDTSDVNYIKRLASASDLALPMEQELELLAQLKQFDLGNFLLSNKGLNGFWTSYIIQNRPKANRHPLEAWILESSPVFCATRERFYIFQQVLIDNLKNGCVVASIPCGLMDDLLFLDTDDFDDLTFVGIDYDQDSIDSAKKNSQSLNNVIIHFYQKDAWNLNLECQFDIITSNGLNIYEPNEARVIELYRNFHRSLKQNGLLVTSFLTPSPAASAESPWVNYSPDAVTKQQALFGDIIGANWQVFRSESETRAQLGAAGFNDIKCIYDSRAMFPTVIARK